MYRIDNATAAVALPAPAVVGPKPNAFFTKGNPDGGVAATIVDDDWANAIQEEMAYAIEQAGIVLSKTDRTQLFAAILYHAGLMAGRGTGLFTYVGTTSCKLMPKNGNRLLINSVAQLLPAGGAFLGVTGLASNTAYYVYAAMFSQNVAGAANNGGGLIRLQLATTAGLVTGNTLAVSAVLGTTEANGSWVITVIDGTHVDLVGSAFVHAYVSGGAATGMMLEASATGHSTDSNGVEIKTGDATRSLVGMVCTDGSTHFQDSANVIGVLSYYNRRQRSAVQSGGGPFNFTVTSHAELSSSLRVSFLCWADEVCSVFANSNLGNDTAGQFGNLYVGIDASVANSDLGQSLGLSNGQSVMVSAIGALAELSLHVASPRVQVSGGGATGTATSVFTRVIVRG